MPNSDAHYQPVLNRLLAKSASDRYSTAEEFLLDLDKLDSASSSSSSGGRHSSRKVLLATLCGLVVAGSIYLGWSHKDRLFPEVALIATPSSGLSEDDHDKVQRLLDSGQMHEIVGRHVAPPGSNALDAYRLVLEIDPANEFAIEAIERLVK